MRPKAIPPVLDGIVLVLDRPRDAMNVGGVVRAMGNFGLGRLRLVEPAAYDVDRIRSMAHRGGPVLDRIERYPSLEAALADCGYVLGTSARARAVRHERLSPRQAALALLRAAALGGAAPDVPSESALSPVSPVVPPVAVLFGPEDRGLSNEALGRCNAVITIPTAPDDSSLNLAQSALLIAYEVWLAAIGDATPDARRGRVPDVAAAVEATGAAAREPLASGHARDEMFAALEEVLWGMHPNNDAGRVAHTLARLRAVLLRAAPRTEETRMLTRFFIHIARERK